MPNKASKPRAVRPQPDGSPPRREPAAKAAASRLPPQALGGLLRRLDYRIAFGVGVAFLVAMGGLELYLLKGYSAFARDLVELHVRGPSADLALRNLAVLDENMRTMGMVAIPATLAVVVLLLFTLLRRPLAELRAATRLAETLDGSGEGEVEALGETQSVVEAEQLANALNRAAHRLREQRIAVEAGERRKSAILEAALDAIVSFDRRGRIVEFNPAAEEVFGYPRAEALGQSATRLFARGSEMRADLFGALNRRVETMARRRDGSSFPAEVAVVASGLDKDEFFTAYLRDVSELRDTLHELAENEARYRAVVDHLSEVVFRSDERGRFTFLNPAWTEITGYPVAESTGREMWDFAPARKKEKFARVFSQFLAGSEESWRGPVRYCTRSGEERVFEVFVRLVRESDGRVVGAAGSLNDITARTEAEVRLRDQLHFVRELIEVIPNPIYVTDQRGQFLGFNRAWESFFGKSRREWLGRSLFDVLPEARAQWHRDQDQKLLKKGGRQKLESHLLDAEGNERAVIFNKATFSRSGGEIAGIIGTITDITTRKQAEQDARLARDAAEAANKAKSDFLANMSHEIRTPMNAIIGMTELALDTPLNAEQREYLHLVKGSADSLLTIINDILDFSKVEAGKLQFERTEFLLRETVSLTLRTLAKRVFDKGLELVSNIAPDVPDTLIGDPTRLRQVLTNLVGNAVKFTERGEIEIAVIMKRCEDNAVELHFSVRDTGIGIPKDKQELIFEAFAQADSSTTRKYGGTGLGLAICSRLVDQMDGNIWVESEDGRGSTFHFTAVLGVAGEQSAVAPEPVARLQGLPVLVLDDNAASRQAIGAMLESWGTDPVLARDGDSARKALVSAEQARKPHRVVILDTRLPGQDALEIASLLRSRKNGAPEVIALLTPTGKRDEAARYREIGAAATLMKPVSAAELLDAIRVAIGEKPRDDAPLLRQRSRFTEKDMPALNILLAEDNPVNQTLAVRLLEKMGHRVTVTGNGLEALQATLKCRYDAILMDVQMPVMGGFEATAKIREAEAAGQPRTPIIAMTAHAMQGDRERCLQAGMDGYVAKPIQVPELVAALAATLGEGGAADGDEAAEAPSDALVAEAEPAFDMKRLMNNLAGDEVLFRQLAELFLADKDKLMGRLRQALEAGDARKLFESAHTLKGSVGNFAAQPSFDAARELERLAREGNLGACTAALRVVEREVGRLVVALGKACEGVVLLEAA